MEKVDVAGEQKERKKEREREKRVHGLRDEAERSKKSAGLEVVRVANETHAHRQE